MAAAAAEYSPILRIYRSDPVNPTPQPGDHRMEGIDGFQPIQGVIG
jgi:hypothetical protein